MRICNTSIFKKNLYLENILNILLGISYLLSKIVLILNIIYISKNLILSIKKNVIFYIFTL